MVDVLAALKELVTKAETPAEESQPQPDDKDARIAQLEQELAAATTDPRDARIAELEKQIAEAQGQPVAQEARQETAAPATSARNSITPPLAGRSTGAPPNFDRMTGEEIAKWGAEVMVPADKAGRPV